MHNWTEASADEEDAQHVYEDVRRLAEEARRVCAVPAAVQQVPAATLVPLLRVLQSLVERGRDKLIEEDDTVRGLSAADVAGGAVCCT